MYKRTEEKPRVLYPDQIKKILRKAFKTDRDFGRRVFFHLWTGTRRKEGRCLTWPSMEFDREEITVTGRAGRKEQSLMLAPVKKIMEPHKKDLGRVFEDLHPDTVSHRFQEIAESCKIKARLHDLRHSCI